MTPDETGLAIELLIQSQQLMAKNIESPLEIAQQKAKNTAQNTPDIGTLTQRVDRLAVIVDDYIRGVRNGH